MFVFFCKLQSEVPVFEELRVCTDKTCIPIRKQSIHKKCKEQLRTDKYLGGYVEAQNTLDEFHCNLIPRTTKTTQTLMQSMLCI